MKAVDVTEQQAREALKANASVTDAAKALDVSRATLYRLMRKHGIRRTVSW